MLGEHCLISVLLLFVVVCLRMYLFLYVFHGYMKRLFPDVRGWSVLEMCIRSYLLMTLLNSYVSLLIFCLAIQSVKKRVVKFFLHTFYCCIIIIYDSGIGCYKFTYAYYITV